MNTRFHSKSGLLLLLLLGLQLGGCSGREKTSHQQGEQAAAAHQHHAEKVGEIVSPTNQIVISNQATVKPAYTKGAIRVPVQGYITYDIRRNNQVAARVGGRIEKLYVRYNNQYVRRGDKIMDLYSPELNTFQDELLYLLRTGADTRLVEQAREKLQLLGLSPAQIIRLEKNGSHAYSAAIYSPYQGFIQLPPASGQRGMTAGSGAPVASSGSMGAMGSAGNTPVYNAPADEALREGAYVNVGQTLFSVNDLQQVWAILSFEPRFSAHVREKDAVELQSEMMPERRLAGTVGLLEPIFGQQQKFIQARAYLPNPGRQLKLNSLVNGEIVPRSGQLLVVPASSVFDLGRRKIVWVYRGRTQQGHKRFEAREILTGASYGDSIGVIRGIAPYEQIAREAGYLVDSESFIQPTPSQP
ncbi:MAG: efflux RND transporter periplasmic adaptor subunit [Adhaeribacter sp.]